MSSIMSFSEAAAIGIHAVLLLSINKDKVLTTKGMSETLAISDNHCAKVMQRLVRAGIVKATRGPGGGFTLNRKPEELPLITVYEAIEGKLEEKYCLFQINKCPAPKCVFHKLTSDVNHKIREHLQNCTFADLIDTK